MSTFTDWDQALAFIRRADALAKPKSPLARMHARYGEGPSDATCGQCRLLFVKKADMAARPFKCGGYGDYTGASTDWRRKWPACGMFEAEQ